MKQKNTPKNTLEIEQELQKLESSILGAILLEPIHYPIAAEIIQQNAFKSEINGIIYQAITSLYLNNTNIDLLTVTNEVKKMGFLDKIGGPFYIANLTTFVASAANLEFHCRILLQEYFKREIIKICGESIIKAQNDDDVFNIFDFLHKETNNLTDNITKNEILTIAEAIKENRQKLENVQTNQGINTGIIELNKILNGWQKTDLVILAARPGMGKTSFTLFQALETAKQGEGVLFFSLEMARDQLIQKLISMDSGIDLKKIRFNQLTPEEKETVLNSENYLKTLPIFIDDNSGLNIFKLKTKLRKFTQRNKLSLVIIDYLQLMDAKGETDIKNRNEEMDYISRKLKAIAKDFKINITALSQLSRAVESRNPKIPMLSDLRESGGIEQNADIVLFIYRPEYYGINQDENGQSYNDRAFILISKHRGGGLGEVLTGFEKNKTRFYCLNKEMERKIENYNFNKLQPNNEFNETPF